MSLDRLARHTQIDDAGRQASILANGVQWSWPTGTTGRGPLPLAVSFASSRALRGKPTVDWKMGLCPSSEMSVTTVADAR